MGDPSAHVQSREGVIWVQKFVSVCTTQRPHQQLAACFAWFASPEGNVLLQVLQDEEMDKKTCAKKQC